MDQSGNVLLTYMELQIYYNHFPVPGEIMKRVHYEHEGQMKLQ